MMIQLKIGGKTLDTDQGLSINIEDSNPIFNDRGSMSIPATIPVTRQNIRLLGAPHRIDTDTDPNNLGKTVEIVSGTYIRRGTLNITSAGKLDGITFNIGFDNSTAYANWTQKKLADLPNLPVFIPSDDYQGQRVEMLLDALYEKYVSPKPRIDEFAIFPVAINKESYNNKSYWEILNVTGQHGFSQPGKVKRVIDGKLTDVSIPEGYCVSPFLKVWRVLELIFESMHLTIIGNPFKYDHDLERLVILNNVADSCCGGTLNYADLLPDCTVEEFLNALWVRFGLVYNINTRAATVSLRLLKDIISQRETVSLDNYASEPGKITYDTPQYVKLSASSSIEDAAPSHDRFEDFVKGLNVKNVHLGAHVSQWTNTGTHDNPEWDGNIGDQNGSFLAREFVTGQWYRLDSFNNTVRSSSSSFFNWDPQPEGLTALELASDDECVPIGRVNNAYQETGNLFEGLCPLYLFGARHYHSYIKGSDSSDNEGDKTPLAFMFAYTVGGKTIGRLNGEGEDGTRIKLDDGSEPDLSLLFQFKDGLFAKFWADYDGFLRHGNRGIEVGAIINKLDLSKIELLDVYTFKGIRCLIDTMSYSLPSGRSMSVGMRLRTIQPQGQYNIKAEQNIPDFSAAARHLEWKLKSETFGNTLNTSKLRWEAAQKYIKDSGYKPHGGIVDAYYIDERSAILKSMVRSEITWENDPYLPAPRSFAEKCRRSYFAAVTYDIHEIYDMSEGPDEGHDWELSELPIGIVTVTTEYWVELEAIWVNNK